ncbi:hypothetical protein [Yoonia sp.]|uniref:hypothetical protein n=1 Tax=Yoonia sp. TaxID=2212373 RepID=UPI003F6B9ED9
MHISFLHTADVHVATFDALMAALAPRATVTHQVDPSLLDRARAHGLASVRNDTRAILHALAAADAVVCTCSTLGPLVDELDLPHVLRIDRPMMEQASAFGSVPLVAICLESTRKATSDLVADCGATRARLLLCDDAWGHFENGDLTRYAAAIATAIRFDIARNGPVDCIVLAQASMAAATDRLTDLGVPVLSAALPAARRAIASARARPTPE